MKIVPSEQVSEMIEIKKKGQFTSIIERLEKGAALRIAPGEWSKKTSIPLYFHSLMNRQGQKQVSVLRLSDDCYYVIKL